jgi:hypothetical protein
MDYSRFDVPLINPSQQSPKQCKKKTPDFTESIKGVKSKFKKGIKPRAKVNQIGFQVNDKVRLKNVTTLLNKKVLTGDFLFDSYDNYDNSCYVKTEHGFTWNVTLNDITLVDLKKDLLVMKLLKQLREDKAAVDLALIEKRTSEIEDLQKLAFYTGKALRKLLK